MSLASRLKYLLGVFMAVPLLPVLLFQGKRVRSSVPRLPEASGDQGKVQYSNNGAMLNLLLLGESTIAGVGVETHEQGFAGAFAKAIADRFQMTTNWKVYAQSGYTAGDLRQKILPRISETEVDLIVIGLGGNDTFNLNSPSGWERQVSLLLDGLKEQFGDTPVVFSNMPPIRYFPAFTPLMRFFLGNLVEIFGEVLEALVSDQKNVYYYSRKITLEDWIERLNVSAKPEDFFSDGVHPSKLTYQTWARDLVQFITETPQLDKTLQGRIRD